MLVSSTMIFKFQMNIQYETKLTRCEMMSDHSIIVLNRWKDSVGSGKNLKILEIGSFTLLK